MQIAKLPLRSIRNGFIVVLAACVLFSCSKGSKLANHIPKDATGVVAFDVKSMALKSLDFKELLSIDGLKKVFNDDDSVSQAIKESGIDILNKAYFVLNATDETKGYGAAIVALSDASKFEAFVKKMKADATIESNGDYKIATLDDEVTLGWSKDLMIAVFAKADGKATLLSLANLKSGDALASNNDSFNEVEKQSADISFWMNFESFQKFIPQAAPMTGIPMTDFNLKDTYMQATCNFEDGQIVVNSKYTTNDEMLKKFDFMKASVGKDVVEAIPGKSVIGLMTFAIDTDKLYTYLESLKLTEQFGGPAEAMAGMSVKDIFTMLNGDLAASVNGLAMKETKMMNPYTNEEMTSQEPEIDYYGVIGIADKEKSAKLLGHFASQGMLTKTDNIYSMQDKIFIVDKGNVLVICGTAPMKQYAIDGKGDKLNDNLTSLVSSNASTIYVNLTNVPEDFYSANGGVSEYIKSTTIDDIEVSSTGVKDKVTTGKFIVRFKDKNKNALLTITEIVKQYGDKLSAPSEYDVTDTVTTDETEAVVLEEPATEPVNQ